MEKYKTTFTHGHPAECEARIANRAELSAYIDKELPPWKRYLIQKHLKKCKACALYVQQLQKTNTFLCQGGDVETSVDFLEGVMARVSERTQHQRQHISFWSRFARHAEPRLRWLQHATILAYKLRHNIQTRSPIYIFALTFCVFTMVGVTLYPTRSDRLGQSAQAWKKLDALHNEKFIPFEVIHLESPKRLLTTAFHQK